MDAGRPNDPHNDGQRDCSCRIGVGMSKEKRVKEQQKIIADKDRLGRTVQRPYWLLTMSILLRACHQVGAAVFFCSLMFASGNHFPHWSSYLSVVSGVFLLAAEAMRHRQIYREVSGLVTIIKCGLIGAAVHGVLPAGPTVLVAFLAASVGAHAPKNIRHRLIF